MSTTITPAASDERTVEALLAKFQALADQWRTRGGMNTPAGAVSMVHAGEVSAIVSQFRAPASGGNGR